MYLFNIIKLNCITKMYLSKRNFNFFNISFVYQPANQENNEIENINFEKNRVHSYG